MADKVTDYYHVEIPVEKDPPDYSTYERRAEVLDFVLSARSPKSVNRTQLAERYDVAVSTITRDIDRLGDAISEMFDEESITLETRALREEIVNDLLDEDDWRAKKAAFDVHLDFLAFLGFDEVLANNEEDEGGPRKGASTSRPGTPDEHRLPKETRDAIDDMMERTEEQLEPFRVGQGDADGGNE